MRCVEFLEMLGVIPSPPLLSHLHSPEKSRPSLALLACSLDRYISDRRYFEIKPHNEQRGDLDDEIASCHLLENRFGIHPMLECNNHLRAEGEMAIKGHISCSMMMMNVFSHDMKMRILQVAYSTMVMIIST